jgi:hypothetical protein
VLSALMNLGYQRAAAENLAAAVKNGKATSFDPDFPRGAGYEVSN